MSDQQRQLSAEQFGCPPVELPFEEAQKRRLCFRKERPLYWRTCDASGEKILSIYPPDSSYPIYKSEIWYGDSWDALDYGQDIDFSRPFFEQFAEVDAKVPRLALMNFKGENSEYGNMTYGNKNCYLIFGGDFNEDCMYGTLGMRNKFCLDLDYSNENEYCYELCDSLNCYGCHYTYDSSNCSDCYYVSDCVGCNDCILSTNLKNKQYYIDNQPYSKEEYLQKKAELINGSQAQAKKNFQRFLQLRADRIVKHAHMINCTDCTGDYLKNSKNCQVAFDVSESEDLKNVIFATKSKDCLESSLGGEGAERVYNSAATMKSYNIKMSFLTIDSQNIEYCKFTFNSQDMFGCVGFRRGKYCILNKQYSEAEYTRLREKLIEHMKETGEWGQYFPSHLSDYPYNESSAGDYFPISKDEAVAQGYKWRDEGKKESKPQTYVVPDTIADIDEQITREVLQCSECQKNFLIMPQELAFYMKHTIAIPTMCSDCRHKRRMSIRNPRRLWTRQCQKCSKQFQSAYAPDRPETVYCDECYLKEIY